MTEIYYWHHPESGSVTTTLTPEPPDPLCESITREQYEDLKKIYGEESVSYGEG
jgi:hypothetical protein